MKQAPAAFVVVDLGFGDAGKGLITDYLVRAKGAGLVVRFNGGAQAGHNVVLADGRHHTFSQLGSGSFIAGVRTHLSRAVVVHPTALLLEAEQLVKVGVSDALTRLSIDPECALTTPFQQAANRIRELLRGAARHGSCGIGFGETVRDALDSPELTLRFADMRHPARAREKLFALRAHKHAELAAALGPHRDATLGGELAMFEDPELPERWLRAATSLSRALGCVRDEDLALTNAIVCEGAQGVLLDERFGFMPYTTFSRTTFDGALDLLLRAGFSGHVERIGVLRSYAVRHGPGPFPTEQALVSSSTEEPHNHSGAWQLGVRKGWLDLVLLDYALRVSGGVDHLALTHLDALSRLQEYLYCYAYESLCALPIPKHAAEQVALTEMLGAAEPRYARLAARDSGPRTRQLRELLERTLGAKVGYESYGPKATDVVPAAVATTC